MYGIIRKEMIASESRSKYRSISLRFETKQIVVQNITNLACVSRNPDTRVGTPSSGWTCRVVLYIWPEFLFITLEVGRRYTVEPGRRFKAIWILDGLNSVFHNIQYSRLEFSILCAENVIISPVFLFSRQWKEESHYITSF